MRKLFQKDQILTIPNLLSLVRLLLIPVFVWLYAEGHFGATVGVIILSGATDIADGIIARRCNMISDFGKILDPIADKLTQAAVLFCLLSAHKWIAAFLLLFAAKEICMLVLGYIALKRDIVHGANWYGKLNTVVLYAATLLLILFPQMPEPLAAALIGVSAGMMILSLVLYGRFYKTVLRGTKES